MAVNSMEIHCFQGRPIGRIGPTGPTGPMYFRSCSLGLRLCSAGSSWSTPNRPPSFGTLPIYYGTLNRIRGKLVEIHGPQIGTARFREYLTILATAKETKTDVIINPSLVLSSWSTPNRPPSFGTLPIYYGTLNRIRGKLVEIHGPQIGTARFREYLTILATAKETKTDVIINPSLVLSLQPPRKPRPML